MSLDQLVRTRKVVDYRRTPERSSPLSTDATSMTSCVVPLLIIPLASSLLPDDLLRIYLMVLLKPGRALYHRSLGSSTCSILGVMPVSRPQTAKAQPQVVLGTQAKNDKWFKR